MGDCVVLKCMYIFVIISIVIIHSCLDTADDLTLHNIKTNFWITVEWKIPIYWHNLLQYFSVAFLMTVLSSFFFFLLLLNEHNSRKKNLHSLSPWYYLFHQHSFGPCCPLNSTLFIVHSFISFPGELILLYLQLIQGATLLWKVKSRGGRP